MSLNFKIIKGDDKLLNVTLTDENGTAVDLTDATITWGLYATAADAAAMTDEVIGPKTIGDGITVTSAVNGRFLVAITDTESDTLTAGETYFQNIAIVDAGSLKNSVRNTDGFISTCDVFL